VLLYVLLTNKLSVLPVAIDSGTLLQPLYVGANHFLSYRETR